MKKNVCAGIVTYNPDIKILNENIQSIIDQVDSLIVVDNYSDNYQDIVESTKSFSKVILFIKNSENLGLSVALNQIMNKAYSLNYKYVVLLDQDSRVSLNLIDEYRKFLNLDFAILSPLIIDVFKKDRSVSSTKSSIEKICRPITSGGLYSIDAWRCVGGFDEGLFIDFIDYDYDQRCINAGYSLYRVNNAFLYQRAGNATISHLISGISFTGGIKFKHPYKYNYPLWRYFYTYRNNIIFLKRCFRSPYVFISELLLFFKRLIHDVFVEDRHFEILFQILKGTFTGILSSSEISSPLV